MGVFTLLSLLKLDNDVGLSIDADSELDLPHDAVQIMLKKPVLVVVTEFFVGFLIPSEEGLDALHDIYRLDELELVGS